MGRTREISDAEVRITVSMVAACGGNRNEACRRLCISESGMRRRLGYAIDIGLDIPALSRPELSTMKDDDDRAFYMPTPEQIKASAAEIREGWDRRTRHERNQYRPLRWVMPRVRYSEVLEGVR